ncbi:MAG: sigma-E processing peptidase SpoIIGA [Clostridia bacterium]|nr:sigma-E processing peptidase SpoIIGA [Clostridia bacterium]
MKVGQTVYADVLFLINFSMDFLVFYICARFAGRRLYPFRSALASALGGAYGVASLFIDTNGFITSVCDVAALIVICCVAFASRNMRFRDFLGRCILFALISSILGGIMTALSSMLERSGFASLEYESGDDISVWLFTIIAAAGGAAAFVGGKRMKRIAASKSADVEIKMNGKSIVIRAMTDTGNMLTDPLSGRAVALCELDAIGKLLPSEMIDYWRSGEFSSCISSEFASKIRFIPARGALGGKTSLLAAVEPDAVTVINDKGKREADILIAPVPYNLSAGESRALLPPGLVD